jgi:hypothetical protein
VTELDALIRPYIDRAEILKRAAIVRLSSASVLRIRAGPALGARPGS